MIIKCDPAVDNRDPHYVAKNYGVGLQMECGNSPQNTNIGGNFVTSYGTNGEFDFL